MAKLMKVFIVLMLIAVSAWWGALLSGVPVDRVTWTHITALAYQWF